jgi:hypothetical protein
MAERDEQAVAVNEEEAQQETSKGIRETEREFLCVGHSLNRKV